MLGIDVGKRTGDASEFYRRVCTQDDDETHAQTSREVHGFQRVGAAPIVTDRKRRGAGPRLCSRTDAPATNLPRMGRGRSQSVINSHLIHGAQKRLSWSPSQIR